MRAMFNNYCTTPAPVITSKAPSVLNITLHATALESKSVVANIRYDGSIQEYDTNIKVFLSEDKRMLTIRIENSTCQYGGIYGAFVDIKEKTVFAQEVLMITSKPSKPLLPENHNTVENTNGDFKCTADVDQPPGYLEILLRKPSDTEYKTIMTSDPNEAAEFPTKCNYRQSLNYIQYLTADFNMSSIQCKVIILPNDEKESFVSETQSIVLIEENYCFSNGTFKPHPRGCMYFILCDVQTGRTFSRNDCIDPFHCFNYEKEYWDICENVPNCS